MGCPIWVRRSRFSSPGIPLFAILEPMRTAPITALLTLTLATLLAGGATAQDSRLPDIGSSADSVLSPAQQSQYGAMTLSQLRNLGYTLDDPLLVA